MRFNSKNISLLILVITAILSSRTMLLLLNDPEGPNLLVVMGLAVIIYCLSLVVYLCNPSTNIHPKMLVLMIFVQIVLATGLYFCLN